MDQALRRRRAQVQTTAPARPASGNIRTDSPAVSSSCRRSGNAVRVPTGELVGVAATLAGQRNGARRRQLMGIRSDDRARGIVFRGNGPAAMTTALHVLLLLGVLG